MSSKRAVFIIVPLIILLILTFLFLRLRPGAKKTTEVVPTPTFEQIEVLPPEVLNASLTPVGGRTYRFTIENIPEGVVSLAYEISYETTNRGTQGIISSPIEIKPGQKTYQNEKFIFGTCSKNVCVYDEGITNLEVTTRLTYQDGQEKLWKKSLPSP